MTQNRQSTDQQTMFRWFGERVLPGLTAAGILFIAGGVMHLIKQMSEIPKLTQELKMQDKRINKLERTSADVTMIQRIHTALDNAELEG